MLFSLADFMPSSLVEDDDWSVRRFKKRLGSSEDPGRCAACGMVGGDIKFVSGMKGLGKGLGLVDAV
jgi:hypothetical protein